MLPGERVVHARPDDGASGDDVRIKWADLHERRMMSVMGRDEEGKVKCMDRMIEEWICETRSGAGNIMSSELSLGGKIKGVSTDVLNARNHVGATLPHRPSIKFDGVGEKHGKADDKEES